LKQVLKGDGEQSSMKKVRAKQTLKLRKIAAKLATAGRYQRIKHRNKQLSGIDLNSLRRQHSPTYQSGRVKEVFDILEGSFLPDKFLDRVHFTKKPIIIGQEIVDVTKYLGPSSFRSRTLNQILPRYTLETFYENFVFNRLKMPEAINNNLLQQFNEVVPLLYVAIKVAIEGLVERLKVEVNESGEDRTSLARPRLESVQALQSKLHTLDDFIVHDPDCALLSFDPLTGSDVLKTLEFCARIYV
jgi:hypothetical protein